MNPRMGGPLSLGVKPLNVCEMALGTRRWRISRVPGLRGASPLLGPKRLQGAYSIVTPTAFTMVPQFCTSDARYLLDSATDRVVS
jgi:hypothetical protein